MIATNSLKKRDIYLNKLIAFQDTEPIKIITGIRRCGKSKLLDLMILHLKESGIEEKQILKMNFESFEFDGMDKREFYKYVLDHCLSGKRMYLFFDEPHKVAGWENVINSFRVDLDCDIYVTGSNSHLLSSEYSTYLSGRYIEIKMYPLSFAEFLYFHDFKIKEFPNLLGDTVKKAYGKDGLEYSLEELFAAYKRYGGMPGLVDIGLEQDKVRNMLDGIYNTVVRNDILQREQISKKSKLTNPVLLQRLCLFLADSIGSTFSYTSITNTLISNKLLNLDKGNPSVHTVQEYIRSLTEAYFYYEAQRYDIKGKKLLTTGNKFYIVDPGFRTYLLGYGSNDSGHVLENIVYFELLRRGYEVTVGKVGEKEVDFRATNNRETVYYQVSESMAAEETRIREYAAYKTIKDNFRKIILTLDKHYYGQDGIEVINVIDWLLCSN